MPDFLQWIADRLESFGFGAYWVIGLVVYLETVIVVGQFLPGSLFVAFVGFLCYLQVFDFEDMVVIVFLSHFAGELTNYYLGRTRGRALFSEGNRFLRPAMLDSAERMFGRGGAKIILLSQFSGMFRSVIPFVAGATRYSFVRFQIVMLVGASLWSGVHLGVGFLFGASWRQAVRYLEGLSLLVIVVIAVFLISGWLIRGLARHTGELGLWFEQASLAIHRSQRYQNLARKHPRAFAFLEARLSLSEPWGFRATVGWACCAALAIFFLIIVHDVQTWDRWRYFDLSVVNLLAQLRNPAADRVFLFFTYLGSTPVVLMIALLAAIVSASGRQFRSSAVLACSALLSLASSQIIKHVYARSRPDVMHALAEASGFSFPSGHATLSVALFASLYFWLWGHSSRVRMRISLVFAFIACVLLIGFSRVYLGVHFPSDVLAGYILGFGVVIFVGTLARNTAALREDERTDAAIPGLGLILVGALAAWIYAGSRPLAPSQQLAPTPASAVGNMQQLVPQLERSARGLTGLLTVPTDIVILGEPDRLIGAFEKQGWIRVTPAAFFTRQINAPVFPAFLNAVPAELTLQSRAGGERRVLRLWPTRYSMPSTPVWLGSLIGESKQRKMFGLLAFRMDPDLDAVLDSLDIPHGIRVERIPSFRKRGLYMWRQPFFTHGDALLLDLRQQ